MDGQNPDGKKFNIKEYEQKLFSQCLDIMKMKQWSGFNWRDLSELAHDAIFRAWCSLRGKDYRMFGLFLRLYADIWQYASKQLDPQDYQYFCCCQSSIAATGFQ